mgnify:FL=1
MIRQLIIEDLKDKDLHCIQNLENEAYRHYSNSWDINTFKDILTKKDLYVFKILKDNKNKIIGYIILFIVDNISELHKITIDKHYQGLGYGSWFLMQIINALQKQNIEEIILEVMKSNVSAISLYQSCGFKRIGERKNYYKIKDLNNKNKFNAEDAIVMQLKL